MTPLGHASIAFLLGAGATKLFPDLDQSTVITATTLGGVLLDLDLLYRFYQKKGQVFDKTIGSHRYFPTHTPLFAFFISLTLMIFNFYFGIFFFLGTLIHLVLDTLFFPEGINFFSPFNRTMYAFLTIKTHPFWAPKRVSQVKNWHVNYLTSPLFWVFEGIPTFIAFLILLSIITR